MRLTFVCTTAVILLVSLAAGCGGSDDDSSASGTSPTEEWADSLCSAVTTWTSDITSSVNSLQGGNVSKDALESSADDVKSATETFVDDIKGLGKPDTDAGDQAKESVDTLADNLQSEVDKIENAAEDASGGQGVLSAVSVISGALATMGAQATSTFQELRGLDAQGELESAFNDAESCQTLTTTGS
jgi:hypothetical protein